MPTIASGMSTFRIAFVCWREDHRAHSLQVVGSARAGFCAGRMTGAA